MDTDINILKAPNELVKPEEVDELVYKLEQELFVQKNICLTCQNIE